MKKNCSKLQVSPGTIKLLMLSWEFPPNMAGGLSRHVFGLSKQLVQSGAEVHLITAGYDPFSKTEKQEGINVHRVKPLNEQDESFLSWVGGLNMAMVYKAEELAVKTEFTIIHAHDWLVGAAAIVLKNELSLPLLTTIHATEHGRNGGIHNELQRFIHGKEQQLVRNSDWVIVCSEYMKQELLSIFRYSAQKITVVPNGVEPESKKGILKNEWILKQKNKIMVFSIGRIVREKGFETIIEAAAIIKREGLNIFFVVAGKGPMLEKYRFEVIEKKLEDYLLFAGYLSDEEKNVYLTESEINVFPSLYEPFGIVVLESLIYGKPTIVSYTGGFKGIIKHKETGLFMLPGNPESLLEQITYLLNHPKQALEIGQRGFELAASKYSWKRAADETKRIMEELLINMHI